MKRVLNISVAHSGYESKRTGKKKIDRKKERKKKKGGGGGEGK